jgi:D-xylulose reductase
LITAAIAHAYSARKIIGIDNSPSRVEFAKKYTSPITGKPIYDHVFLSTDLPITPPSKAESKNELSEKIGEQGSKAGIADGEVGVHDDEEEHLPVGDHKWEWAKIRAAEWLLQAGLDAEEGVDRVIEATGSEDCGLYGVAIAKQGANCQCYRE